MGWRLYRIWSIDWFRNPEQAIDACVRAVERAVTQGAPDESVPAPPVDPPSQPNPGSSTLAQAEVIAVPELTYGPGRPYRLTPPTLADRSILLDNSMTSQLASEILRVVLAEEPIHPDLVLEQLKMLHGVGRAGANVRGNFEAALSLALQQGPTRRDQRGFLWARLDNLPSFRVPDSDADCRAIEHIPFEEIRLAALHVVESQFGLPREALVRETASVLGFGRVSAQISDGIVVVIETLIDQGELKVSGFQITLP
jgi:hypothetical protein